MRDLWQIGIGVEIRITAHEEQPPVGGERVSSADALAWARWAREDGPRGHRMLLEMAEAISGSASTPRSTIDWALRVVERAISDGRLRAFVVRNTEGGGKGPGGQDIPSEPPPPPEEKTFIAIQLMTDEPEPKPVAFKRYRIELPDHSIREGQLDQFGRAQVVGIDPGTCKVSFPDFDAADWKAA